MKIRTICKMHFPLAILNADWMNACRLLDVRINNRQLELLFLLQILDRFKFISIDHGKKANASDLYQTLNTHILFHLDAIHCHALL